MYIHIKHAFNQLQMVVFVKDFGSFPVFELRIQIKRFLSDKSYQQSDENDL